eukprot:s55_g14.t5
MFHEVSDASPSLLSLTPRGNSPTLSPIIGLSLCSPVHIVLLGDSTLDNSRHVDVSIQKLLAAECSAMGWECTFLAQDGANLDDVAMKQLGRIPDSATHVILSVSGNDLLRLLNELSADSFAPRAVYKAVTVRLDESWAVADFDICQKMRQVLQSVTAIGCHVACCTVYAPQFDQVLLKMLVSTSLAVHNGRIRKMARDMGLSLIDLAFICTQPSDFANALELSTRGGNKECLPRAGLPPESRSTGMLLSSWLPQVACCTCAEKTRLYADPEVLELRVDEEQLKSRNCVSVQPVLQQAGVDTCRSLPDGTTTIHFAAEHGNQELASFLVQIRANLDQARGDGATALHLAADFGHVELVSTLLEAHADPLLATDDTMLALHLAARSGHAKISESLHLFGSPLNASTMDGLTPLHFAACNGHIEAKLSDATAVLHLLGLVFYRAPRLLCPQPPHVCSAATEERNSSSSVAPRGAASLGSLGTGGLTSGFLMLPCSYSGDLHEEMPIRRTARVIAGRAAMSSGRAPECWLHGVHLPPKASWPQEWRGDFAPGSEDFLMDSAERRYRLETWPAIVADPENVLQRAASGQTLTAKSRSSSRYGDFSGLQKPTGQPPILLSKAGITWEADGNSSLLIPLLLSDVMFAPVNSTLVFPFSRAPEATHVILIAPRAPGKSAATRHPRPLNAQASVDALRDLLHRQDFFVWLLCTNAGDSDYSLDHLIMSFSRRGAVRWDVRQCHHFSANSCGQGGHGTIFGGVSLLPLYDAHRKLIPLKGDVLNMNKVHNFGAYLWIGRVAVKIWDKLDSGMVRREVDFLQQSAGHPNISALLGIYAEAQKKRSSVVWLLVMEHCTGGDFFDIIKEKYLSIARILDIQAGLASALTHLHRLRIVHRDVKAENVVMHKEHAVLIDFGIAAYLDDQEAMCRPVGSPGYAAPEIIAPTPRLYDELVDVFALGVLSYFMMFRALPFWAGTHEDHSGRCQHPQARVTPSPLFSQEMLEKTRQCEVEIPELDDDSMRPVVSLVLRMMSKEAPDRPSAVECFNELREMAPEVTKSRKASRAFRIAHMALVRYGCFAELRHTRDISLDEFSENEGADMSEVPPSPTNNIDVSPVPTLRTPAAPAQTVASMTSRSSMLSGVGSVLSSARRRIPSLRVPRVGQTVSKVFRNMAHLWHQPKETRQSSGEKAKENESAVVTSRQSGHCFEDMDGLGVVPSPAKHEQAEADAGPQQEDSSFQRDLPFLQFKILSAASEVLQDIVPGRVASNYSDLAEGNRGESKEKPGEFSFQSTTLGAGIATESEQQRSTLDSRQASKASTVEVRKPSRLGSRPHDSSLDDDASSLAGASSVRALKLDDRRERRLSQYSGAY